MAVYLKSFAQISTQTPLDRGFFHNPEPLTQPYTRAQEADYSAFIPPLAARRMGAILKRAIATSVTCIRESGIGDPDAIVFGTGLGCIENTEKFLTAMVDNAESCLQPTHFINSTHNTIAAQVATFLKCNGYNSTYAHLGVSFESALMDVLMQFELGAIRTAVVGAHDEMTPTYFHLFDKVNYWDAPVGEAAVSIALGSEPGASDACRLLDVDLLYAPEGDEVRDRVLALLDRYGLRPEDIDLVVSGRNGDARYDGAYNAFMAEVMGGKVPECRYRHVFGESFTSSAYGVLLGAAILSEGTLPKAWRWSGAEPKRYKNLLIINSFQSRDWSFVLLQK